MNKNSNSKFSLFSTLIIFLLCCSIITGPAIYIVSQEIQFFRIMLFMAFVISMHLWWNKRIHFNSNILAFTFFIYFDFIWTTYVALFTSNLVVNSFFNSLVLVILIATLSIFSNYKTLHFLQLVYCSSLVMFLIMLIIATWEIHTKHHLSVSTINQAPIYIRNTPTTFFTNPNDFMAVMCLIYLIVCNYHKKLNLRRGFLEVTLLIALLIFCSLTGSRTNMIVSAVTFGVFWFNKKRIIIQLTFLLALYFAVSLIDLNQLRDFLSNFNFNLDRIMDSLEFGKDESSKVRYHLYLDAFKSISTNYGLGEGVNNSADYFRKIDDPNLEGITNPHNYLLEILINSGPLLFSAYLLILFKIVNNLIRTKNYYLLISVILYFIVLLSSSSSLYLFYHYLFFISILVLKDSNKIFRKKGLEKAGSTYEKNSASNVRSSKI